MAFKVVEGITYTMRERGVGYELFKWEDGENRPVDMYVINVQGLSTYCNCPSRQIPCKHIDLMQRLIKAASDDVGGLPDLVSDGVNIWARKWS